MTDDPQTLNPVTAEQAIQDCIDQVKRAPRIIAERVMIHREAKAAYDLKMAEVADATEGTELAKKRAAVRACVVERRAMDEAYRALQYAKERAKAFREELSGLQTINKSVGDAYNNPGRRW